MNNTDGRFVAISLFPRIAMLIEARAQAAWQAKVAAGEHQRVWLNIMFTLDEEILKLEQQVTAKLELNQFRWKHVVRR